MPGTKRNKQSGGDDDEDSSQSLTLNGIRYPGQNDVKFGRGGDTNYHIGNSRFRFFVGKYKPRYQTASKEERVAVVQEIIKAWRSQDPPGRFLARTDSGTDSKESIIWHDVGNEMAFKKTVKVLGEGLGSKRKQPEQAQSQQEKKRKQPQKTSAPTLLAASDSMDRIRLGSSGIAALTGVGQNISLASRQRSTTNSAMLAQLSHQTASSDLLRHSDATPGMIAGHSAQQGAARSSAELRPGSASIQFGAKRGDSQHHGAPAGAAPSYSNHQSGQDYLLPLAASLTDVFNGTSSSNSSDEAEEGGH